MMKFAHALFASAGRRWAASLSLAALLCAVGLAVLSLAPWPVAAAAVAAAEPRPPVEAPAAAPTVPGELVLAVPAGLDRGIVDALAQRHSARVERWLPRLGLALLSTTTGRETQTAHALAAEPLVDFVTEHRLLARAAEIPLDEHWGQQWGMMQVAGPAAWDLAWADPSVVVAVLDTGVNFEHWDLASQIWLNPGESAVDPLTGRPSCLTEIATNLTDDDDNGYTDDCLGYDFVQYDNAPLDEHGHGTFVAGITAAATNNLDPFQTHYTGIAGMGRQARLMNLRVLDASGRGSAFNIAGAIDYATAAGAKIINLSLTFPPATSGEAPEIQSLRRAVEAAQAANVLVIAASGNEGYNGVSFPAKFPGVLAVGASTRGDLRASFSNYGARLDLVAPGVEAFSTLRRPGNDSYGYYGGSPSTSAGTSFATPFVAGAAALVRSLRPDLSQADVYELIRYSADDVGDGGWDVYTGWGRLNAQRAVHDALFGLQLHLAAEPASVMVGQQAALRLSVTAPDGAPAGWGARVALSAGPNMGQAVALADVVAPSVVTVNGAGQAEAVFTAGAVAGTATVTATLGNLSVALPITVTADPHGLPAAVTVAAAANQIAVGGETAAVRATAVDIFGAPVLDGTVVTFTTSLGTLRAAGVGEGISGAVFVTTTLGGSAEAVLVAGQTAGTAEVCVTATPAVMGAVAVRIMPGPVAQLALSAAPDRARTGGRVTLTARVLDQYGNHVADGAAVNFVAEAGQLDQATALTRDGVASTGFTLPGQIGDVQVEARSGPAADRATVAVLRATFLPLAVR